MEIKRVWFVFYVAIFRFAILLIIMNKSLETGNLSSVQLLTIPLIFVCLAIKSSIFFTMCCVLASIPFILEESPSQRLISSPSTFHFIGAIIKMGLFDNIFKRNKKNQGKTGREPGKKARSKTTPTLGSKSRPKSSCKNNQGSSNMARDNQPESTLPCSPTLLTKVAGKGRVKSPAHSTSVDLDRELATPHLMPSSLVTNAFNRTYDCVAFLIHCPTHLKICAAKSPTGAVWLPYVQKPEKTSWYGAAQEGAMHVLSEGSTSKFQNFKRRSPFNQMLLLEMARVQMPNTNKFVDRFTFYMRLKNTEPNILPTSSSKPSTPRSRPFVCCVDTSRLMWLSLDYICEGFIPNCWGPELVDLSHQVAMATNMVSEQSKQVSPFTVPLVFRQRLNELGVEELFDIFPHRDTAPSNNYMESLKQIKTSEKGRETERLFTDFLDHCFPSFYMPYDSFRHYFRRNNFETSETRLKRLFNVFNRLANGFLSFPELAMGLICIERETPHVEFRIKFLFDYYDTKKRGALNEDDFTKMVRDMNMDKYGKIQCTDEKITRTAREAFAKFRTKIVQERASVTYPAFLAGIGTHVFRGTSILVRSKRNVFACISRRLAARAMKTKVVKGGLANMVTKKNYLGSCQTCKTRQYKVVSHLSIITPDGYCSEQIEALEMPAEVEKYPSNESDPQMSAETSIQSINFVSEPTRTESSAASLLLATIRQFNENKPRFAFDPSQPMSGIMTAPGERETLVKLLQSVADEIIPLLANEPRCKPVPSPAFLIGDIHGKANGAIARPNKQTLFFHFS